MDRLSCPVQVVTLSKEGFFAFSADLGRESVVWGDSLDAVQRQAEACIRRIVGRFQSSAPVEVEFVLPHSPATPC